MDFSTYSHIPIHSTLLTRVTKLTLWYWNCFPFNWNTSWFYCLSIIKDVLCCSWDSHNKIATMSISSIERNIHRFVLEISDINCCKVTLDWERSRNHENRTHVKQYALEQREYKKDLEINIKHWHRNLTIVRLTRGEDMSRTIQDLDRPIKNYLNI